VNRARIWGSLFIGLVSSLMLSFLIGAGIPILIYSSIDIGLIMLLVGIGISTVFVSIAFLSSIITRDKAKGIGISIMLWLFFALLFDGLVLFLLFQLSDYPIEKIMVLITAFNPIDLARILILLHLDASAMMGYTGAIFKEFFGSVTGMIIDFIILLLWIIIPFLISRRLFKRKDL
jgi:Cu-processing system permease protein